MESTRRNLIFILPHLRVNTTSVSRFKSIIKEAVQQGHHVKVIEFLFPLNKSIGLGQQLDNKSELEDYIKDHLVSISIKPNILQKAAFFLLNKFEKPYWKVVNWLHQGIFNNDIFYPGKPVNDCLVSNHQETMVIAFGGPFGVFSYAEEISDLYDAKLVLDYRDPWTFGYVSLDSSPFVHSLKMSILRKRELRILEKASLITTVSNTLKSYFPAEYQFKVNVFENGTNFNLSDLNLPSDTESFNIVYLGTIYNNQLQDEVFFRAVKIFIENKKVGLVKWYIIGAIDNKCLINKISEYGLTPYVEITPRIAKAELLRYLKNASVFLHLRYGQEKGIITSKQADYLFFNKPILLPVSDSGDISESIIKHNAGYVCNTVEENLEVLETLLDKFTKGEILNTGQKPYSTSYTRKEIAAKFLDKVVNI